MNKSKLRIRPYQDVLINYIKDKRGRNWATLALIFDSKKNQVALGASVAYPGNIFNKDRGRDTALFRARGALLSSKARVKDLNALIDLNKDGKSDLKKIINEAKVKYIDGSYHLVV